MNRKHIMLMCTIGVVLLAGCSGFSSQKYNVNETVNSSEAVESVNTENKLNNQSEISINLHNTVHQNDEYTSVIIIGGVPQTQYFDDWKEVQITNVTVVSENETTIHTATGSNLNGDTITFTANNSGSYEYEFASSSGGVTEFGLELDNGTIVNGYSDDVIQEK